MGKFWKEWGEVREVGDGWVSRKARGSIYREVGIGRFYRKGRRGGVENHVKNR